MKEEFYRENQEEDCFLKQKATMKELQERFDGKPSSNSVYTIDGIAYTVVSHYAGEKDIDEVISKLAAQQAYADMSLSRTQEN